MTVDRESLPGERVRSADVRLAELRDRIERLQAGHASTPDDARRAQQRAELEKIRAARASQRLGHVRRRAQLLSPSVAPDMIRSLPDGSAAGVLRSGHDCELLDAAYRRTRSGLMSLLLAERPLDETEDVIQRQSLDAILDRAFDRQWQGWSSAVCGEAVAQTPGISGVGISLAANGLLVPVGASDTSWTPSVEEIYLTFGEGPAIDVVDTGRPVVLDKLDADETRWPGWIRAAERHGVRALWCHPLSVDNVPAAAMSFYLTDDQPPTIKADSEHVQSLVGLAERLVHADLDRVLNDDQGLGTSDIVHVAAGMLSIQLEVGTDEAISRLRARAFATGRSLTDTAIALVERRLPFV